MDKDIDKPYLDHARVDMAHCLADGLFLPALRRENGNLPKLDLRYPYSDKYVFWWRNYEALDVADLCVFLALHRIANEHVRRVVIEGTAESDTGGGLWAALKLNDIAATPTQKCVKIETTLTEIARIVGVEDGQKNLTNIFDSLVRMSSTTVAIYKEADMTSRFWQAQLIAFQRIENRRLTVGLNPRLTQALFRTPTTYVDMREFKTIKNKVAKRLYVWLSAWANTKRANSIGLDLLIPHVWGKKADELDSMTLRNRRRALRAAVADVAALPGWTCAIDASTQLVRVQKRAFIR